MITRLTGTIHVVEGNAAAVEPAGRTGVWHEVLLPTYLAMRLAPRVGEEITFATIEYMESVNQGASFIPRLIGFETVAERKFFELFTTVKGIGNRKALRAMAVSPAEVARAIAERDVNALRELPEIGSRLAETIIAELHGKVEPFLTPGEPRRAVVALAEAPAPKLEAGPESEAVAALVALGEETAEAHQRVKRAIDAAKSVGNQAPTADELVLMVYAGRIG